MQWSKNQEAPSSIRLKVDKEGSFTVGNNISLAIVSKDLEEVKSLFHKLKEGGKIGMELQETFWSKCYGSVTDKFGIEWQFNYDNGEQMQFSNN